MNPRSSVETTRTPASGASGVVAAGHVLAADAGRGILERGGNAVDAAVAAAFVAGVVEPWNTGIGGHGFCSVHMARSNLTQVFDWVTRGPDESHEEMFELDEGVGGVFGFTRVKDDAQATGYLAAEAPATGSALAELLGRHGTMPLRDVLEPAIELALGGYPVDWRTSLCIADSLDYMRAFPALASIYAPDGLPPRAGTIFRDGDRLVLGDLGKTLQRFADEGPDLLSQGAVADAVVAEVRGHGGILTMGDLAHSARPIVVTEPTRTYRGITYVSGRCPIVVEVLNILEWFDLAALGPDHPLARHLMIEAMRQAWVDALTYLGDPADGDAPWQGLLSKEYAADVAERIDLAHASDEPSAGDPWRFEGRARPSTQALPSSVRGPNHTTQVVAIDRWANMVSLEESLGSWFGSKVAIPGTGIVLGNGMQAFDPRPGRMLSVAPDKRPLKIAPAILAFKDGRPWLSICASGGRTTTAAALHTMVNLVDFRMGLQAAVETPRVHAELGPAYIDDRASDQTVTALRQMGHRLRPIGEDPWLAAFGRPSVAMIDPTTGMRLGGGDALHSAGASAV